MTDAEASLLAEGAAMLEAVLTDLLKVREYQVQTCVREDLLTADLFRQAEQEQRLIVHRVSAPEQEAELFLQACQQADVAWIIAPEFEDLLFTRTSLALESGVRVTGSDVETIRFAADKWQLFQFLQAADIPTIETELAKSASDCPRWFPCLIKHRYGAGGLGIERFQRLSDWQNGFSEQETDLSQCILQPWISGRALSAAVMIREGHREILPVGEQRICWESGFEYQGGVIPTRLEDDSRHSIRELLNRACDALPGLAGYVGFDILLPDEDPCSPLLVEINPRLTTAYVGYRQLTDQNLARLLVEETVSSENALRQWEHHQQVVFQPDGHFEIEQIG